MMIISQNDLIQEDIHIYLKSLLFTLKKEELIRYEELTLKLLISITHCYESPQRVIPTQKKNPHVEMPNCVATEGITRYKQVIKTLKSKAEKSKDTNQLIFLIKPRPKNQNCHLSLMMIYLLSIVVTNRI